MTGGSPTIHQLVVENSPPSPSYTNLQTLTPLPYPIIPYPHLRTQLLAYCNHLNLPL